jgi:hypothetical protein
MSGYSHIVDSEGRLLDPDRFSGAVPDLKGAYELAEQLYGMVWWLAAAFQEHCIDLDVEDARKNYKQGIEIANRYINNGE